MEYDIHARRNREHPKPARERPQLMLGAAWMVICADADFVVSAAEVAVTAKLVPAVLPAVKSPVLDTVPPVEVQLTALLLVPVTVAVNCFV